MASVYPPNPPAGPGIHVTRHIYGFHQIEVYGELSCEGIR